MTRRVHGWIPGARVALLLLSSGILYLGAFSIGAEAAPSLPSETTGSIMFTGTPTPIGAAFWGLNVNPTIRFGAADVDRIEKTPVTYFRYPGGLYAEEYNYTSGVITQGDGTATTSLNPIGSFIGFCEQMRCRLILELPLEINDSATAASYVSYVERTLGYTPAYWELGNSPGSYSHFSIAWSHWLGSQNSRISPTQFAEVLKTYIAAVRAVDPSTPILALGGGELTPNGDARWVIPTMQVDGPEIAGVSVHSYAAYPSGAASTLTDFFAAISGPLGLPGQIGADRLYVAQGCATCPVPVFVTEDAPTYGSGPFYQFDAQFPGALFEAAQVTQALSLGVPNVDWFEYESNFSGDWIYPPGGAVSSEYVLFSELLSRLGTAYVPTSVTGAPSSVYAAATVGPNGSSLLVVNVNSQATLSLNVGRGGTGPSGQVTGVYWSGGSPPRNVSYSGASTISMAPLSVAVFSGLGIETGAIDFVTATHPSVFASQYLFALGGLSALLGAATVVWVPSIGRFLGASVFLFGVVFLGLAVSL